MRQYEQQVQDYIFRRCREHLVYLEKVLGRPITFDYRYEHTRTTVEIADSLAGELGVDPDLARIAAWLHDVAKCWDPNLDEAANKARAEKHGPAGGREAAEFLDSIGFPRELTAKVEGAITVHVGFIKDYILDEPLDALLWDADKLSKISWAGIMHYLGANLVCHDGVFDMLDFFTKLDREFHRGIRDSLNTKIARRWADGELEASARLQEGMIKAMAGNHPNR